MTRDGNTRRLSDKEETDLTAFQGVQVSHLEEEEAELPAGDAVLRRKSGLPREGGPQPPGCSAHRPGTGKTGTRL